MKQHDAFGWRGYKRRKRAAWWLRLGTWLKGERRAPRTEYPAAAEAHPQVDLDASLPPARRDAVWISLAEIDHMADKLEAQAAMVRIRVGRVRAALVCQLAEVDHRHRDGAVQ